MLSSMLNRIFIIALEKCDTCDLIHCDIHKSILNETCSKTSKGFTKPTHYIVDWFTMQ